LSFRSPAGPGAHNVIESSHWAVALAVAVLIGVAGTLYFRIVVMRRDETEAGLAALAGMSWREFIHLVLDALGKRGYTRVFNRKDPSGDNDYALERGGKRWLLSCKHGRAFVLGESQVAELANEIRLANAAGGILATQGSISKEARPAAKVQRIELLDGPTLWPELRELMGEEQRAPILAGAAAKARQRTLLSWLLALVAGLAVFTLAPRPEPSTSDDPLPTANAAATKASEAASAAAAPISAPPTDDAPALEK